MTAKKTAGFEITDPVLVTAFAGPKKSAKKSHARVRKPAAKKPAALSEINTDTLASSVACIPDVETFDQMCERIAEANRRAHTV